MDQTKLGKPLQPWGIALKALLHKKGISQNAMVKLADKDNNEFYRACRGERGPGIRQMDRYLEGMNASWVEFGEVYEAVKRGELIEVMDLPKRSLKNKHRPSKYKRINQGA